MVDLSGCAPPDGQKTANGVASKGLADGGGANERAAWRAWSCGANSTSPTVSGQWPFPAPQPKRRLRRDPSTLFSSACSFNATGRTSQPPSAQAARTRVATTRRTVSEDPKRDGWHRSDPLVPTRGLAIQPNRLGGGFNNRFVAEHGALLALFGWIAMLRWERR